MAPDRDQRRYNAAYYARNRDAEILRVVTRQRATLDLLRDLRRVPCADCGGAFPPFVMDFDHRDPREKSFQVTDAGALLKRRDVLLAEIAKCDVVCANCHCVRTYEGVRSGKLTPSRFQRAAAPAATHQLRYRRDAWRKRHDEQTTILDSVRARPCADCGVRFPLFVMQFDHRDPSQKRYLVSQMPGRVKLATLMEEIAKCDVVCANCHRVRTYWRRQVTWAKQLQLLEDAPEYLAA
jgi:hypothetical protein